MGTLDHAYYESPLNVLTNGNFCVTLFYVLSGFVLSRKYWEERNFRVIASSAKRRFPRLFIPVAAVLFISFILLQCSAYRNHEMAKVAGTDWWLNTLWPMDPSFSTFLRYLFVDVMFLGSGDYDTSMWTMKTELFGSFLVFGLLALIHLVRRPYLVLVLALVILAAVKEYYYTGFVAGIMLNGLHGAAFHQESLLNRSRAVKGLLLALMLGCGLILGSYPSWTNFAPFGFWKFIYALPNARTFVAADHYIWIHVLGATLVVSAAIISGTLQRILGSRLFVFLGLISFSLYLLHPLVLGAVAFPLFLRFHESMGYNQAAWLALSVLVLVTVGLAWLMAVTVDRWAVELPRKWLGTAAAKRKPAPVAVKSTGEDAPVKRRKKKK
jgi:peptidoglycan/LPS O-acetylase OafA/YrhL